MRSVHDDAAAGVSTAWRKSSHSNDIGNCVELAEHPDGTVSFRDSKDPAGPVLTFPRHAVIAFVQSLRSN
jgi:hypothetical protein